MTTRKVPAQVGDGERRSLAASGQSTRRVLINRSSYGNSMSLAPTRRKAEVVGLREGQKRSCCQSLVAMPKTGVQSVVQIEEKRDTRQFAPLPLRQLIGKLSKNSLCGMLPLAGRAC